MSSNELMGTLTRGFSAVVRMELITNDVTFPLSQIGPDQVKLKGSGAVPVGIGEVRLYVDGQLETWRVRILPAAEGAAWVPIENVV